MKTHAIRLLPGDDLYEGILRLVTQREILAGCILSGVGSLSQAALRMAGETNTTVMTGPFEIIALTGTVSVNGCHLHIGLSGTRGQACGGHLVKTGNRVLTTAELVIAELPGLEFTRAADPKTGYKELKIAER